MSNGLIVESESGKKGKGKFSHSCSNFITFYGNVLPHTGRYMGQVTGSFCIECDSDLSEHNAVSEEQKCVQSDGSRLCTYCASKAGILTKTKGQVAQLKSREDGGTHSADVPRGQMSKATREEKRTIDNKSRARSVMVTKLKTGKTEYDNIMMESLGFSKVLSDSRR